VVVVMLGLGIGVNAAVFTVTNAALFRGFRHIDRNDRILYVYSERNGQYAGVSYPDFQDWRAQTTSFESLAAAADMRVTLLDAGGFPERTPETRVSANAFRALGQQPILGRDFVAADDIAGAEPVAILTYRFWTERFGRDPAVIGRTLPLSGMVPATV